MALENCDLCRNKGFTCTETATLGKQEARVVVLRRGSQFLDFPSLQTCKSATIDQILAQVPMASKVAELVLA